MTHEISKTLNLDLRCYQTDSIVVEALFKFHARKADWTEQEINLVLTEAHRLKDHDHFMEVINKHCEVKFDNRIDPKEVWEVLSQLGLHTHYLANKSIAFWDTYDLSNYRSLMIKAGKLKKVYGIYDSLVNQDDVSSINSHPPFFFKTKEEAQAVMQDMVVAHKWNKEDCHVLFHYIKQ